MSEHGAVVEWYWQEKQKNPEKNLSWCHFINNNPTKTAMGTNSVFHDKKLVNQRVNSLYNGIKSTQIPVLCYLSIFTVESFKNVLFYNAVYLL